METETMHTGLTLSKVGTLSPFVFQNIDLPSLIRNLKNSPAWEMGEISPMVLSRNPGSNVVIAAMHEGTEIVSFQSNDSVSFQIIEGRVRINTMNNSLTLEKGYFLKLSEKTKYKLTTSKETVLLLSIEKNNARNLRRSHGR